MIVSPEREGVALFAGPRSLRLPIVFSVLAVLAGFSLETLAYERAVGDVNAAVLEGQTILHILDEAGAGLPECDAMADAAGVQGGGGVFPSLFVAAYPGGAERQELKPVTLQLFDFYRGRPHDVVAFEPDRVAEMPTSAGGEPVLGIAEGRSSSIGLVTGQARPDAFFRNVMLAATIVPDPPECVMVLEPWAAVRLGQGMLAGFSTKDRTLQLAQRTEASTLSQIARSYDHRYTRWMAEAAGALTLVVSLLVYRGVTPHLALYRSFGVSRLWRLRCYAALGCCLLVTYFLVLSAAGWALSLAGMPWLAWREGLEAAALCSAGVLTGIASALERVKIGAALRDQ